MDLLQIYERLRQALGGEDWWKAEGPWEVMVGAMLTQQTTWQSVERALASLGAELLLSPEALAHAPLSRIEACVRPTGFYRTKARRLRLMAAQVLRESGTVEAYLARPPDVLRRRLLALEGVGEETADAILLYASGHPTAVVDAYTRRILSRLGHPLPGAYDAAARQLRSQLPDRVQDHRRFHALMVGLGKAFCRPTPRCAPCPLVDGCPHGQALLRDLPQSGL